MATNPSTLTANDTQVAILTRLLIGLLRQTEHDANKGKPMTNRLEVDVLSRHGATTREVEQRIATQARAVIRQEFLTADDAKNFMLKWSIVVDDLPDRSAKAGDAELTVHPVDPTRVQEIVRGR